MDILPTLVKLAGSEAPNDRIIDGKDIWPLLSGQTKASPHEALFYFNGLHVRAVRSGPWKLFVSAPGEEQQKGKAAVTGNSTAKRTQPDGSLSGPPLLYNLDTDIGEKTDVAAKNPDVVKKLLGYVSRMEADLGEGFKNGSGVRPCGNVDNPKPLLLSPQE
jgi:arylsulfatase A-like enzyme